MMDMGKPQFGVRDPERRHPVSEAGSWMERHEHWKEFSEASVVLLRALRNELSSHRWEIMLDVDAVQDLAKMAMSATDDSSVTNILVQVNDLLEKIHRDLARIPEDFIPAF
jgi:hypothetical protein